MRLLKRNPDENSDFGGVDDEEDDNMALTPINALLSPTTPMGKKSRRASVSVVVCNVFYCL